MSNDLKVEYRSVDDLIPYARNARTHSDEQVTRIAASIKEFGFTNPILIDGENGIIAGHGRLAAAKKLGMVLVPTIELKGLTTAQKRAYILADNKMALDAGWDSEMLKVELDDLKSVDFDLQSFGLDSLDEIASVEWDDEAEEINEENYNEPDKRILECPNCHHRDSAERFKKVGEDL